MNTIKVCQVHVGTLYMRVVLHESFDMHKRTAQHTRHNNVAPYVLHATTLRHVCWAFCLGTKVPRPSAGIVRQTAVRTESKVYTKF